MFTYYKNARVEEEEGEKTTGKNDIITRQGNGTHAHTRYTEQHTPSDRIDAAKEKRKTKFFSFGTIEQFAVCSRSRRDTKGILKFDIALRYAPQHFTQRNELNERSNPHHSPIISI